MSYRVPLQQGIVLTLRRRFILVRLPAVLFSLAASVFITVIGPSAFERGVGWFGVAFSALIFLIALRRMFDTRPQYWINAEGVHCLRSPVGLIRWQEIRAAAVVEMKRQQFFCLYLEDPERVLARLPRLRRWLKRMNQDMGFGTFSFALGSLEASPAEIQTFVTQYVPGPESVHASRPPLA